VLAFTTVVALRWRRANQEIAAADGVDELAQEMLLDEHLGWAEGHRAVPALKLTMARTTAGGNRSASFSRVADCFQPAPRSRRDCQRRAAVIAYRIRQIGSDWCSAGQRRSS
jgi:hypothetical protein